MPSIRTTAAALAVTLSLLLAACAAPSSGGTTATPRVTASASATTLPTSSTGSTPTRSSPIRVIPTGVLRTSKILTIVVENHSLHQMRTGMPYLNSLARRYGYATDYRAVTHPSLPNYLAIAFGTTAGVRNDRSPRAHHVRGNSVFSLADRAKTHGRLYAESMGRPCQRTNAYPYAVRHNPWAYGSAGCAAGDVPAGTPRSGQLRNDARSGRLPCAGMLIPNLVSDAHDSSLAHADRYLRTWLPTLMAGPDFRSGRLTIVVTADEDDHSSATNRVLTVVISRAVSHKVVRSTLTHYSLTRLYNNVCREGSYLGHAATAPSLGKAFGLTS